MPLSTKAVLTAMPVASVVGREILDLTRTSTDQGRGVCVGCPLSGMEVRIIAICDDPIADWSDAVPVENGSVGEIIVRGDQVTRRYFELPSADALAKIRDGDTLWHRMGDLGRIDDRGRIWFFGRKSQRVITTEGPLFTIPCEGVFNNHPAVYRSALVGVGRAPRQKPVICIELEPQALRSNRKAITRELLALARGNEMTRTIDTILYPRKFPVDIRHNAKIFREKLARWAEARVS